MRRVSRLGWLHEVPLYHWGDIDTHGSAILDRLRAGFPSVQSMLMDRATLLAHETQWDREPVPVDTDLVHLTAEEAASASDTRCFKQRCRRRLGCNGVHHR